MWITLDMTPSLSLLGCSVHPLSRLWPVALTRVGRESGEDVSSHPRPSGDSILDMGATLRIEIFPADVAASVAFYESLGFEVVGRKDDPPYASIRRDEVRIGMVQSQPHSQEQRAVPIGTEIVIAVDEVRADRDRAVAAGVELAEDLREQPWGLTDFRVTDPDGYYLRFTDRR